MKTQKINLLLLLLIFFIAATYIPLFIYGGIIVDDWGNISHNLNCLSFTECYGAWFPLFSNRPLAPLPITTLTFIFENNYAGYLIANSLIFFFAITLCAKIINEFCDYPTAIIFSALASIPFIAIPLIASPINQSTATVSFLFWGLSLYSLFKFIRSGNRYFYIASYALLLSAFLTYEVILPLLALSIFLSFIDKPETFLKNPLNYLFKYVLPVLLILFLVTLWQKGIAPQFMEVDSRLKFQASHIIPKIYTWTHVFFAQIPQLFLKAFYFLNFYGVLTAVILTSVILVALQQKKLNSNYSKCIRFTLVATLCFLSSCSIFILSDESAVSSGYQARGLSSTWFAFALLLSGIFSLIRKNNYYLIASLIGISFFSSLSFSVQRDQYIKSWELQTAIIRDASHLIRLNHLSAPATVIGNVPKYLENNYNDEIVFSQPWDFGSALALNTNRVVVDGFPIDIRNKDLRFINTTDDFVSAQNWAGSNFNNLWFYDFDQKAKKGTLTRVVDGKQLLGLIKQSGSTH